MNADLVCAVLGVSKAFVYKIMKGYNEELKERGFLVIPGKISTKFLAEKIYGMKVEE
ncbi:MAG: DNA-binding protein [Lachnospiraceae bacterium]|nr:DNA-binding protein [Lachnospiraceae bacterium]